MRLAAAVALALALTASPAVAEPSPAPGSILAPAARQAAWLNLDAPRPRVLTHVPAPSYVSDVAVTPIGTVVAVQSNFGSDQSTFGGDLLRLDVSSGEMTPLVT